MDDEPKITPEAIAAMEEEWERIGPRILAEPDPEMLEDERDEALKERLRLLQEFLMRHGPAVQATRPEMDLWGSLGKLNKAEKEFLEADEVAQARYEELLHATADLGEAQERAIEESLATLERLEGYSEEKWAAMEAAERSQLFETLCRLRELRPQFLANLPAERRRYWEGR